jgi:hypothetical protein
MVRASLVGQRLKRKEFDVLLLKVIDEQLIGLFGEIGARYVYEYLVKRDCLKKEDIPKKIDVFAKALEDFFGSGAYVIQRLVLTNMHSQLGRALRENAGFAESIAGLKQSALREHL